MKEGIKFDCEKPRWDLLQYEEVEAVVRVLTNGAKKYADDNWKKVEPYDKRYFAAAMRHIVAWNKGEILDDEDKEPHLAHAICCLLFIMYKDKESGKYDRIRNTNNTR